MMTAVELEIRVEGLDRLVKKVERIAEGLESASLDRALDRGAELIENMELTLVAVRTGNLKSTIHRFKKEIGWWIVRAAGPKAPYGKHVEYGTIRMAAQSFVRAAVEWRRREVVQVMRDHLRELMR